MSLILVSLDGFEVAVPIETLERSKLIKNMLQDITFTAEEEKLDVLVSKKSIEGVLLFWSHSQASDDIEEQILLEHVTNRNVCEDARSTLDVVLSPSLDLLYADWSESDLKDLFYAADYLDITRLAQVVARLCASQIQSQ